MSTISNRHSIEAFTSTSKALTGQRLIKVGYKGADKFSDSICMSVPKLSEEVKAALKSSPEQFFSVVQSALEQAQHGILKALWESSGATLQSVGDDEISIQSCLAFLSCSGESVGRLTKEVVKNWFETDMKANLMVILSEKLQKDQEDEKVLQVTRGYAGLFESCAAPVISLTVPQLENLQFALEYADNSPVTEKLKARIADKLKEKAEEVELICF
jgi:hypothetical protein